MGRERLEGRPTTRPRADAPRRGVVVSPPVAARGRGPHRRALAAHVDFARVAGSYWSALYPHARRELRAWELRAGSIASAELRADARAALAGKRRDAEGAAAFALFAPPAARARTVRLLVAFQSMYAYLDTLSERPSADPVANGRALHAALAAVFAAGDDHPDYFAHHPAGDDGGYLRAHVDACRDALRGLPAHAALVPSLRRVAAIAAEGQTLNHAGLLASADAAAWLGTLPGAGLRAWELAAASSSPLAFYPLLAAAADPRSTFADALAVEGAYFPWVCALAAMLDSAVDEREDERDGTHSAVRHYDSPADAAERVGLLATRSLELVRALPGGRRHAVIVACIVSYYACEPEATDSAAHAALAAIGTLAAPTLLMFRARQAAAARR